LKKLVELVVGGPGINENTQSPVSFGHDLRRVRDRRHRQTADVDPFDLALAELEDESHATEAVGGTVIHREIARAHQLARTGLDVTSLQVPRHPSLPSEVTSLASRYAGCQRERQAASMVIRPVSARLAQSVSLGPTSSRVGVLKDVR